VDCGFNVSVLWMLYGLSFYVLIILLINLLLFFLHFFKNNFSEIINFRRPTLTAENKAWIFGGLEVSRRK
jgi:hypothetical protein